MDSNEYQLFQMPIPYCMLFILIQVTHFKSYFSRIANSNERK